MNVLSIDFDYFQNADEVTVISYFPSPNDMDTDESVFEWLLLYDNKRTSKVINDVSLLDAEYNSMCDYLNKLGMSNPRIPCVITNSHRYIYNFIQEFADPEGEITVMNVDMHHDMFNPNRSNVDCGNWGNALKTYCENTKINWIKNPYASAAFPTKLVDVEDTDLELVKNYQYDLLFLCRSDNYLVPHLDKYFKKMWEIIDEKFYNVSSEEDIQEPRILDGKLSEFVTLRENILRKSFS